MKRPFNKPAKTIGQQLELLQGRGLRIDDTTQAKHYLSHLNYYRLAGYWHPFYIHGESPERFRPDASFDAVLNLYVFDREFRLLLLDAIERIEVSVRTQWAYQLAHAGDSHAYMNPEFTRKNHWHHKNLERITKEVKRSRDVFIDHYKKTYSSPQLPPIWAVCEIMSLGTLAFCYKNLRPNLQQAISENYHFHNKVMSSFLHHISHVRNRCAHHCRVWNAKFTVTLSLPRSKPKALISSLHPDEPKKIYNTLVLVKWLMDIVNPEHTWHTRLIDLLKTHNIDPTPMGFPGDYQDRPIWR